MLHSIVLVLACRESALHQDEGLGGENGVCRISGATVMRSQQIPIKSCRRNPCATYGRREAQAALGKDNGLKPFSTKILYAAVSVAHATKGHGTSLVRFIVLHVATV